ncbi:hypothetical protein V6N13_105329 [Hibiscus sabdariffa]
MRELVRGLLGKVEQVVRALNDFQASSVFWVELACNTNLEQPGPAALENNAADIDCLAYDNGESYCVKGSF